MEERGAHSGPRAPAASKHWGRAALTPTGEGGLGQWPGPLSTTECPLMKFRRFRKLPQLARPRFTAGWTGWCPEPSRVPWWSPPPPLSSHSSWEGPDLPSWKLSGGKTTPPWCARHPSLAWVPFILGAAGQLCSLNTCSVPVRACEGDLDVVQSSKNRWWEPVRPVGAHRVLSALYLGVGAAHLTGLHGDGTSHPSTGNGLAGRRPEKEVYVLRGLRGIFQAFSFSLIPSLDPTPF